MNAVYSTLLGKSRNGMTSGGGGMVVPGVETDQEGKHLTAGGAASTSYLGICKVRSSFEY